MKKDMAGEAFGPRSQSLRASGHPACAVHIPNLHSVVSIQKQHTKSLSA